MAEPKVDKVEYLLGHCYNAYYLCKGPPFIILCIAILKLCTSDLDVV